MIKWVKLFAVIGIVFALFTSSFTEIQAKKVSGSAIVKVALSHHEPYRYGVSDCSALTKKVYKKFGYNLPRTAKQQARVGHAVSVRHLKAGDLVFFYTGRRGVVSHVGIYAGKGKMVDAEYSGIKKTGIFVGPSSHYWKPRYAKARRVFSY